MEAELKDYEVVTGSNGGGGGVGGGQERCATKDATASDNDWEKQIDELLANSLEDDEDLK